ncbi:MAG: hypothetical protein E7639_06550 [Ruminococcaceae bacterium]|nr:hypothetical protein [Oscillospiraceae bacterium]
MELICLGVAAFILIFNVFVSFTRGFRKSLLRLITVLVAAVASFFLARAIAGSMGKELVLWMEATLGGDPNFAPLFSGEVAAGDAISQIVKMLVAPVLFLLSYIVLKGVLIFIYWILCGVTRPEHRDGVGSHFLGVPLGLVIALVGILVFVTPVLGYTDLFTGFAVKSSEAGTTTELSETVKTYHSDYIAPVNQTPVLSNMYSLIGNKLFDGLTGGKWQDDKLLLRDELDVLGDIVIQVQILGGKPVEAYGAAECAAVDAIAQDVGKSHMLSVLCSGVLNTASNHWLAGQTFLGIAAPDVGESGSLLLDAFLVVFSTSTRENIDEDLDFFADVFTIMVRHEIFAGLKSAEGEEQLAALITDTDFLGEVQLLLDTHPRMQPVGAALVDVGMRAVLKSIGLPEDMLTSHGELLEEMSEALKNVELTPEGQLDTEALTEDLGAVFESYDIEVSEASTQLVAQAVADHFTPEELQSLTVEDVMEKLAERFHAVDVEHLLENAGVSG